ncbi:MAG: RNA polymerase sigma factor for flagellar operon FliA [Pirellulaceae bacterium]|jgi:RNA polymerase sigma factor for flagellar operon FliA
MNQIAKYKNAANAELSRETQTDYVEKFAPLVKRIAYHLMSRLPPTVQVDDLIQSGMIGLLEAARNYDAEQGASFETYAGIRIRGSMLDEIRKGDWAPRSLHRRVREITRAVAELEAEHGRDARDSEVADRIGTTLDEYYHTLQDASGYRVFSFEDLQTKEDGMSEGLTSKIRQPLEEVEDQHFKAALAREIAGLPERERLVMSLYYKEELNLRETGDVLGVSESRVCQIHSQALIRLKSRMADWSIDASN